MIVRLLENLGKLMLKILSILLMIICFTATADIRSVHCPIGCPSLEIKGNDIVFNHTYALSNNPKTKFADWVAYEVNVLNFGESPGRKWGNDPLVDDDESLEEQDFKGAFKALQTDKGHQAPLASFAGHDFWYELNYLSNITPQKSALNQDAWVDLESAIRSSVGFRKSLFVITGPLYLEDELALPNADESHVVPSAYFKVVYDLNGNGVSFLFDQDLPRKARYCDQMVSNASMNSHIPYSMPVFRESKELIKRLGC